MSNAFLDRCRKLRPIIEKAAAALDDKDASQCAELYPQLTYSGALVKAGTRINWDGRIKRAAVDLWDTEQNNPENASTLWEDIAYRDGIRIIPEVITAGTAFSKDEKGYWGYDIYTSLIDNNVWNPEQYAAGWEKDE